MGASDPSIGAFSFVFRDQVIFVYGWKLYSWCLRHLENVAKLRENKSLSNIVIFSILKQILKSFTHALCIRSEVWKLFNNFSI